MWSQPSSSRRKKTGAPGSPNAMRRSNKGAGWNEDAANEMFDELVTDEMPDAADMEGEFAVSLLPLLLLCLLTNSQFQNVPFQEYPNCAPSSP
jgi:hypothetical protein